jgi:hypothetical protein
MSMSEPALVQALKQAHATPMFFAFVLDSRGTDGKLIASRRKIHSQEIAEAGKGLEGGITVRGTFSGPITRMVFKVIRQPPATLAGTLKNVIKRDADLHVVVVIQVASESPTEPG